MKESSLLLLMLQYQQPITYGSLGRKGQSRILQQTTTTFTVFFPISLLINNPIFVTDEKTIIAANHNLQLASILLTAHHTFCHNSPPTSNFQVHIQVSLISNIWACSCMSLMINVKGVSTQTLAL